MKKKIRGQRTPINSNVERLDHMIDQSLVRKKNFKPFQNITNERALFEMIDTRIGHMLAKSCEIESKIEAIEKKRPKKKNGFDSNANSMNRSSIVVGNYKKKVDRSPQSVASIDSTETEESIPQLQSASKFLIEQNGLYSNSRQSSAKKQKVQTKLEVQQKQEAFKQQKKQTNLQNKKKEEINFFQQEQEEDQDQDIIYQPKQQSPLTKEVTLESLLSLIQTLANEVHEMHEEQEVLKGQIAELQNYILSDE